MMKIIPIFKSNLERLIDELIKEWLKERYMIISASRKRKGNRNVLVRKAHLRRRIR